MDTVRDVSVDFQMQRSDFDRTKMQNVPTDMLKSDLPSFSLASIQEPSQSSPLYHIMVGWICRWKMAKFSGWKSLCVFFRGISGVIFPSVSELVFIFRLPRRSLQWFELCNRGFWWWGIEWTSDHLDFSFGTYQNSLRNPPVSSGFRRSLPIPRWNRKWSDVHSIPYVILNKSCMGSLVMRLHVVWRGC